jgi:acetyl-CoA decarbonylase/synthase complex subunit gamma
MAKKLSGLKIQKLLPKTNCKECGSNTCLAFAMKLASQKAELSDCPYASEEAIAVLGAASEPPVKGVALGKDKNIKLGEETVLYRHEKTFVNQTAIAININDTDSSEKIDSTLDKIKNYVLDRVGELLTIDVVSVTQKGTDATVFVELVKKANDITGKPIIINSSDIAAITAAAEAIKGSGSVISAATATNADELAKIAKDNGHALVVTGSNLDEISATTTKLKDSGFNDLILNYNAQSVAEQYQINSIARIAALKSENKSLGYASLFIIQEGDLLANTVKAITEISKYGGLIVLPSFNPAQLVGLMTLRQNIYTDPQKPIQVEPKLYPIGEPTKDSPIFLTTNFSLTYFIVAGEIENSGISAWLIIPECEGMSVLTAWAAGKFSGAYIAKFMKEIDVEGQVNSRNIIIPGYVAQISGELQESLPGWDVTVGPQEAADIESFVKQRLSA